MIIIIIVSIYLTVLNGIINPWSISSWYFTNK